MCTHTKSSILWDYSRRRSTSYTKQVLMSINSTYGLKHIINKTALLEAPSKFCYRSEEVEDSFMSQVIHHGKTGHSNKTQVILHQQVTSRQRLQSRLGFQDVLLKPFSRNMIKQATLRIMDAVDTQGYLAQQINTHFPSQLDCVQQC